MPWQVRLKIQVSWHPYAIQNKCCLIYCLKSYSTESQERMSTGSWFHARKPMAENARSPNLVSNSYFLTVLRCYINAFSHTTSIKWISELNFPIVRFIAENVFTVHLNLNQHSLGWWNTVNIPWSIMKYSSLVKQAN